jgi:signal transduction histidine kinase
MLNTLMDISEAESGAMPLKREWVKLSDVVARAVELYRDVADAKGVALSAMPVTAATSLSDTTPANLASDTPIETVPTRDLPATDDVAVFGDQIRLEQVVANLLDNAVKYTPAGGHVFVEVDRAGDRAIVRVRDTGSGIPADELPRIWDRLFRGDSSRTTRGLGLGLSLVKAVIEAHGGTVSVASELGRGSTFAVSLPIGSSER